MRFAWWELGLVLVAILLIGGVLALLQPWRAVTPQ